MLKDNNNNNNSLPAIINGGSSLVDEHGGEYVVGKLVTFDNKGSRYVVEKNEELPMNVSYKPTGLITCWERRENGKIVERRVTEPDQPHPKRETLGHLKKAEWPISKFTGQPEDVWQDSRYLQFYNPRSCIDYTFVSRTKGGRKAISELKQMLVRFCDEYPNESPLIKLGHVLWNTQYGLQPRPEILVVVAPPRDDLKIVSPAPLKPIDHGAKAELRERAQRKLAEPLSSDDDLNDPIPELD
jgi:hypothetical protein